MATKDVTLYSVKHDRDVLKADNPRDATAAGQMLSDHARTQIITSLHNLQYKVKGDRVVFPLRHRHRTDYTQLLNYI